METSLLIAIVAAAVSIIGWVANHIFSEVRERQKYRLEASLRFTERQLEELYGPLAFLVLEGTESIKALLAKLGRKWVFFEDETIPKKELKLWLFWVENDFFPRNDKIKKILMEKTHLVEGGKIPQSYLAFIDHHNSWKTDHLLWQKEGIKYPWTSKSNWPDEFEREVLQTFEKLKERHTNFLKKLST